jgi:tetratricopeptide (TPR) repeat protein
MSELESVRATDSEDLAATEAALEPQPDQSLAQSAAAQSSQALTVDWDDLLPVPRIEISDEALNSTKIEASTHGNPERIAFWMAQIEQYEREIQSEQAASDRAVFCLEIGRIADEHLGNHKQAAAYYQKAFALDKSNLSVLHAARRLFTEMDKPELVVNLLDAEIEVTGYAGTRALLMAEKANWLHLRLDKTDEARLVYQDALEVWAAEPLLVHSLEQLHLAEGDAAALLSVYRRAVAIAQSDDKKVSLYIASARLAESQLNDPETAVANYEAVLTIDASHRLALAALRRLYGPLGRWTDLVSVFCHSAKQAASARQAEAYLVSAARVEADMLKAPDRALALMSQALQHAPDDVALLHEIEWLYEETGNFEDVCKVLSRQAELLSDSKARNLVLFRRAAILEEKLKRPDEAGAIYQEILQSAPGYEPAVQALGRLLERKEDWPALAELYALEIAQTSDNQLKVALLFKLAELHATHLEQADDAIRCLLELLATKPNYVPAIRFLERLYVQFDHVADLIELYRLESRHVKTDEEKQVILLRIAQICELQLSVFGQAAEAYQAAADIEPTSRAALEGARRCLARLEQYEPLLGFIDRLIELEPAESSVLSLLQEKAEILQDHVDDVETAVSIYEKILLIEPTYLPALSRLGRLYQIEGRFESLVNMHRREIDNTKSADQKVNLLFCLGELLVDRIEDDDRALVAYQQILEVRPKSLAALNAIELIASRTGNYERIEFVLSQEAALIEAPRYKASLLQTVAEICEFELDRPDRAAEALQEVLRLGQSLAPDDRIEQEAALEGLIRIFSSAGLWSALALTLQTAADNADEPREKAAILVRLAEIYADKLEQADLCIETLQVAAGLVPDDLGILDHLERMFAREEKWEQLLEVSAQLSALEVDVSSFAARKIRMADIFERKLKDRRGALDCLRQVLEKVPTHPIAVRAMEIMVRRAGDWKSLLQLYRREAMTSTDAGRRAHLLFRAADIAEIRLADLESATELYDESLAIEPSFMPAIRAARRLALKANRAERALELLQSEGERTSDVNRSLSLLLEAAEIYQEQLQDEDSARLVYESVLKRAPGHEVATTRLQAIYRATEDWPGVVELMEKQALAVDDVQGKVDLLRAAGHAAEDKLGDFPLAIRMYRKILEFTPQDQGILTRLGPLLLRHSDFELALSVYQSLIALSTSPAVLGNAYRTVGLILEESQDDLVRAVQAYQSALSINSEDMVSLNRLADLYLGAEDWASAVNVMLRLNECDSDSESQLARCMELASLYRQELNDLDNARLALLQARDLDSSNVKVNLQLVELFEMQENWPAMIDAASKYFSVLPAARQAQSVALRVNIAKMQVQQHQDEAAALQSLDTALTIEPYHKDGLTLYASIASQRPELFTQAIEAQRRLLRLNPFNASAYHEMRRMFESLGEFDKAFVVCELLIFLRAEFPEEDLFFSEFSDKVAPHSGKSLSAEEHASIVLHYGERGIERKLMEIMSPELGRIFPEHFASYDLKARTDRLGPKSESVIREIVDEARGILGAPELSLWISPAHESEVFIESAEPLALIVGQQFDRRTRENEKRFVITQRVEGLKGGHQIFHRCDLEEIEGLINGAALIAGLSFDSSDDESVLAWSKRLQNGLSRRCIKALKELGENCGEWDFDLNQYLAASTHTRNRAGMLLTNNVQSAIKTVARENEIRVVFTDTEAAESYLGKSQAIRELMAFIVSEEYFAARAKLGFSIQSVT